MNKLAIQSHLLGADMLGLENILVVAGDDFNSRELKSVKQVRDFSTTGLIASIKEIFSCSTIKLKTFPPAPHPKQ